MSEVNINSQLTSSGAKVDLVREGFDFSVNESGDDRSCASSTTQEQSSQQEEYIPGTFEGPEKTMEVVFHSTSTASTDVSGDSKGLRNLSREQLDRLCHKAKCSIMSMTSNKHMDAYVLSESSLFVYAHRVIMKTCGTTTLLRCLSTLLHYADELGLELSWVGYSRKNFLYPTAQMWPHTNFGDEMRYISSHEKLHNRLKGEGYILGPVTGDHWFVYVAESTKKSQVASVTAVNHKFSQIYNCNGPIPRTLHDHHAVGYGHHSGHYRTINLMMFDMSPETASIFFGSVNHMSGKEMTVKAGIQALCPGATIDEQSFEPCGYSMNAILHDAYTTIHVTPEAECSYVSFETNTRLSTYCPLVRQVLAVFQPKRFVLTLFGDQPFMNSMKVLPTDKQFINMPVVGGGYRRTSVSNTKIEQQGRQGCVMACYLFEERQRSLSSPSQTNASVVTEADIQVCFNAPGSNSIELDKSLLPIAEAVSDVPAMLPPRARERAYSLC